MKQLSDVAFGDPAAEVFARTRCVHDLAGLGGAVRGSFIEPLPAPGPVEPVQGRSGISFSFNIQGKGLSHSTERIRTSRLLEARIAETGYSAISALGMAGRKLPYAAIVRALVEHEQLGAARALVSLASRDAPPESDIHKMYKLLSPPAASPVRETDDDRTSEYRWLISHASEYRGRWVAVDGEQLIAHADSLKNLLQTLRQVRGRRRPLVHRIE